MFNTPFETRPETAFVASRLAFVSWPGWCTMNFIQDRQIVDETGLIGRFDFTVMVPTSSLHSGNDIDNARAFLLGLQPLGFKLLPKKEPLEVIVIDNLEKPTAN